MSRRRVCGLLLGALLLLPGVILRAQTPEPPSPSGNQAPQRALPNGESVLEEREIVLPEELLQVEEAVPEDLQADLPELQDPTMAALAAPLPEPGELEVPKELFNLPPPTGETAPPAEAAAGSLYSNGLFGAGSMSYIIGAISLYRIGATPGFQFDFSHEARDGYNFEEPGNGFFDRDDQIGVSVSGRGDSLGGEVRGRFTENEKGLQGLSDFFSTTTRRVDGSALMDYAASPIATVTAGGSINTAQRIYNSDGGAPSPRDSELVFTPEAGLLISTETTDTTISASYRFRSVDGYQNSDDLFQTLRGSVGAETSFWPDLLLSAEVGLAWRIGDELVFPFSLGVTAILTDFLTLEASGGYETTERSFADVWQRFPFLSLTDSDGDILLRQDAWVARANVSLNIVDQRATLEAGAQFEERYSAIDIDRYEPDTGLYQYDSATLTRLIPQASLLLEGSWWRSRLGWEALLGDRSSIEAPQSLGLDVGVFNETETLRADAILTADLYQSLLPPELTIAGHVSATDSIEISVELRDIFSFFLDDGRPSIGEEVTSDLPFIDPGFLFAVLTRISL